MPQEFAAFFSSQPRDVPSMGTLDVSSGSSSSAACVLAPEGAKNTADAPAAAVVTLNRNRVPVVDGLGVPEAPDADDFSPDPLVPSNQRRGRGRPRGGGGVRGGVGARVGGGAAPQIVPGVVRRARGGGRAAAERARRAAVDLAQQVDPLLVHVRPVQNRARAPVIDRGGANSDDDDAVDASDGSDNSAEMGSESDPDNDDDDTDRPQRKEKPCFVPTSWTCVARAGVAGTDDVPLQTDAPRIVGTAGAPLFGVEVPSFRNQHEKSGAYPFRIDTAMGRRGCTSTTAFVKLLFTDEMVDKLVVATNKAAHEYDRVKNLARIKKHWRDVTRDRMFLWLAIATYLGVVKIQNRKEAWSKNGIFRQSWLRKQMHLHEFDNILTALNFCDHWNLTAEEFARRQKKSAFWQIEELVKECNKNSQFYFRLGHRISIDEACIPWKGRHRCRCFNKNKPSKFHFKKFMLNCATTGYNYNYYWYAGASERRPEGPTATSWPVQHLLESTVEKLQHKNHLLAIDNWFTSSHSFAWLAKNGFAAVGTVGPGKLDRENVSKRKLGFPTAGIFKKGRARTRAAYVVHQGLVQKGEDTAVPVWVTAWQDRNPVHFMSTYPPRLGTCKRKVKIDNVWHRGIYPRPSVAHHYNQSMGGTDLHDQRCSLFRTTVRSARWHVRVITDTFNSMMQNAFILYCSYHNKGKDYSSLDFIKNFLEECGEGENPDHPDDVAAEPAGERKLFKHTRPYWISGAGEHVRLSGRNHWPKDARKVFPEWSCNKKHDLRRHCTWDPQNCGRTFTFCSGCKVPLCLEHFECFHTSSSDCFPVQIPKPRCK